MMTKNSGRGLNTAWSSPKVANADKQRDQMVLDQRTNEADAQTRSAQLPKKPSLAWSLDSTDGRGEAWGFTLQT